MSLSDLYATYSREIEKVASSDSVDPNTELDGQEELEQEADAVIDVADQYVALGREMARRDFEALQETETEK